jgi:hypothetical protein
MFFWKQVHIESLEIKLDKFIVTVEIACYAFTSVHDIFRLVLDSKY